jgi:YebC/PmpR family DNA-binding regulatory protein
MAGHSKWNNIKNKKGAADERRAKVFTDISKLIKTAVKEHGSADPNSNPALRLAMEKARAANMPKDNVQRAIDRGLGKSATGALFQDIVYEGFGPKGVGLLIVAVTDNLNRTSSEIRLLLSRAGGSLGGPGSAGYLFERTSSGEYTITIPMEVSDPEDQEQLQNLLDALRENDDVEDVYCAGVWEGKE